MRIQRVFMMIAILAVTAVPAYVGAQIESTPVPAPEKPNFSSMSFLVGTWTCSTKSARRPAAYVTTTTYALDPTGYWMTQTSATKPTAWISRKLTTYDRITYDPDSKRWVDLSYGDGGAYDLSFASGWSGDKIIWKDAAFAPGPDISGQGNTTFTKVSPTKVTSTSWFTETKTGRHVSVDTTCTKSE